MTTRWASSRRMIERADQLGHADPEHYLWCASQHHKLDPTKPAEKWDTAWRALRDAAGLPKLRFHDLRHTVVTRLLEAGEPDHVVESITGHLSRRMLEHYSHIRLSAKKQALDRLSTRRAVEVSDQGTPNLSEIWKNLSRLRELDDFTCQALVFCYFMFMKLEAGHSSMFRHQTKFWKSFGQPFSGSGMR